MRSMLDNVQTDRWIELAIQGKYRPRLLARLCGQSLRQLERYFLEAFRTTPKHWLHMVRMSVAAQALMQDKNQKEISASLGFSNVPHFVREFKRHYGITPSVYFRIRSLRAQNRTEVPIEWLKIEDCFRRRVLDPRIECALLSIHRERFKSRIRNGGNC